jgi:hypothetical protein
MFGGNASQVTVSVESAGGSSIMLQDMAYGGSLGSSLFVKVSSWTLEIGCSDTDTPNIQAIAASPYLPMQYGYKDWIPSQSYYAFATKVGCAPSTAYSSSPQTIFSCLVSKDTHTHAPKR